METLVVPAEVKIQRDSTDQEQLYSVEDVFNEIDNKFVNFYGEYGRKIVNSRREEWNREGFVNLQTL